MESQFNNNPTGPLVAGLAFNRWRAVALHSAPRVECVKLNKDSIRRKRQTYRAQKAQDLKAAFQGDVPLVVHWDGKLLEDLAGNAKVDRLPVVVSGKGVSQLLTVAKLPSGTGEAQAEAVHESLLDWNIANKVKAMCFDTTSSNTGRINGACVLLEQKLGKELLSLACRHHVMELIIGAVFQVCFGGGKTAPEVPLFKRFQANWVNIDQADYETGIVNENIFRVVKDFQESMIEFANAYLESKQPRDDYQELLELTLIFLGNVPARGIRFRAPGATHHARWMAKVIYCLKIWMFHGQFKLTHREEKACMDLCMFAVCIYVKAWMTAPVAVSAPMNDLQLLQSLLEYSSINAEVSKAASQKLSNHLWYLAPELVGLALFDSQVSAPTKRMMVRAMQDANEDDEHGHMKRITVDLGTFAKKKIEDFVSPKSKILFKMMDLPDAFLDVDPDDWEPREDYQKALAVVKAMNDVNDHAERGVALIQEYSGLITKNESQLQYLLQIVQKHRQKYPDSRKQTLV